MSENPMPPNDPGETLAEAVREVYREMARADLDAAKPSGRFAGLIPEPSPRAVAAFNALLDAAELGGGESNPVIVEITPSDVGDLLSLALGFVMAQRVATHPELGWVRCDGCRSIMRLVCGMFLKMTKEDRP
jgi:hypothetical protein